MNLELKVPEIKESSNSTPYSLSISKDLDLDIRDIKSANGGKDKKLFNELHRQALGVIVEKFKNGEIKKAG